MDIYYTIVFDSGRALTDVVAESEEEARYFAEELVLPTEEISEIYPTK